MAVVSAGVRSDVPASDRAQRRELATLIKKTFVLFEGFIIVYTWILTVMAFSYTLDLRFVWSTCCWVSAYLFLLG